jgi:5-formyltetrahydrofolate cyclo-ligase
MAAEQARILSDIIARSVLRWDVYSRADSIVLYAALGREVSTDAIRDAAWRDGKAVYYPKIAADGVSMSIVRVTESSRFAPGALGVMEPADGEIVDLATLADINTLIIVPGIVFSPAGDRIGRGGGHYDRFLAGAPPSAITAGLGYGFQLLDHLPRSAHDRRLDFIVTEFAIHPAGVEAPTPARDTADQGGRPRWT